MSKKLVRGKKPEAPKEIKKEEKPVVNSNVEELPPIDPIYRLSPLERANALPDYSKTFTREKHIQMLNNMINADFETVQRITKYGGKYLSIHELQMLDMARRSLDQQNDDRHKLQGYMWERVYGKDVQKIEHSGAISQSDAVFMDTFGMDSISPEEMEEIAGIKNDSNNDWS